MNGAARKKLCEVAKLVGGGTPSRKVPEYFGGEIHWVTPSDLPPTGDVRVLASPKGRITGTGLQNSSAKLCPAGTVLFSSRASIGKIAVAETEFATNQGFCNFIPVDGVLDSWFLAYYLAASTHDIVALAAETTFKEVSRKKLATFEIPVPRLDEQRRIVGRIREAMERVDELRWLWEETRRESRSLFTAVLQGAEADAGSSRVPVGELIVESRNGRSIKATGENGNGKVLTLACVRGTELDTSKFKSVVMDDAIARKYQVERNDVFISRANTAELVGLSSMARTKTKRRLIYPDLMIRLRVDRSIIEPRYLMYSLRFPMSRKQIQERATGSSQTMVKISGKRLRTVTLPVPSLETQRTISDSLDEAWQLTSDILAEYETDPVEPLRAAILRKAFAGEL